MRADTSARAYLLASAILLGGGCMRARDVDALIEERAVPSSWSATGDAEASDRWWEAFDDPELNNLVAEALGENLDVKMAAARLAQARALAGVSRAALSPSVDGSYAFIESDPSNPAMAASSISFTASYEIDLFGGARSAVRAAEDSYRASVEDAKSAMIAVAANVATNWYELVALRERLALLGRQLDVNERYLKVVEAGNRQGRATRADLLQQRQQVLNTKTDISATRTQAALREHTLAVLLGRLPTDELGTQRDALPELPPVPATGVPADVLRARPDVMGAEYRLRSANHSLGEAIAARFPRLSLSATGSYEGADLGGTFDNWLTSLVGNLLGPICDGGRRRREVERNEAVVEERLASYRKTVLEALKEVEDALERESGQRDFVAKTESSLALARDIHDRQRARYVNGQLDYAIVVGALRSAQGLESALIDARRNALMFRIQLYRALGGGWDSVEPATPGEV